MHTNLNSDVNRVEQRLREVDDVRARCTAHCLLSLSLSFVLCALLSLQRSRWSWPQSLPIERVSFHSLVRTFVSPVHSFRVRLALIRSIAANCTAATRRQVLLLRSSLLNKREVLAAAALHFPPEFRAWLRDVEDHVITLLHKLEVPFVPARLSYVLDKFAHPQGFHTMAARQRQLEQPAHDAPWNVLGRDGIQHAQSQLGKPKPTPNPRSRELSLNLISILRCCDAALRHS